MSPLRHAGERTSVRTAFDRLSSIRGTTKAGQRCRLSPAPAQRRGRDTRGPAVMALKLFAHVLRSEIPADGATGATAAVDARRWVFRDLVVRRADYAAWGLSPRRSPDAAPSSREPAAEPLWPDTQPWCHE